MYSVIIPVKHDDEIDSLKINGKHFLVHKLESFKVNPSVGEVIVTTDSAYVKKLVANMEGVKVHWRELTDKENNFPDVVTEVALGCIYDDIVWSFITTPFCSNKILIDVLSTYEGLDFDIYDSLVTCKQLERYIFDENGPINFQTGDEHKHSSELPLLYELVNGFFVMKRRQVLQLKYPWGVVPFRYLLDRSTALEIKSTEELSILKEIFNYDD